MTKKTKRILLIGVPILVVGVSIILLTKKKKAAVDMANNAPFPEPTKSSATPVPSQFPLKKGSRGSKVEELQRLLGVTADGIFGSGTEGALKAYDGVTQINSQVELDALAAKKSTAKVQADSVARAQLLRSEFAKGGKSIYVSSKAIFYGYIADSFGAINYTKKDITMSGGTTLDNRYWKIIQVTKSGNVQVECTTVKDKGTYVVNPNVITVV